MEGLMKKENPEKLATLDIQETRKINVREYLKGNEKEQSRKTGNIGYTRDKTNKRQRIPKGKCKRTILINWQHRVQDAGQIKVREYRRGSEKGQSK